MGSGRRMPAIASTVDAMTNSDYWWPSSALELLGEVIVRAVRDVEVGVQRVRGARTRDSYAAQQRLDELTDPRGRLGAPEDDLLVV